jgi:hypothetical protein
MADKVTVWERVAENDIGSTTKVIVGGSKDIWIPVDWVDPGDQRKLVCELTDSCEDVKNRLAKALPPMNRDQYFLSTWFWRLGLGDPEERVDYGVACQEDARSVASFREQILLSLESGGEVKIRERVSNSAISLLWEWGFQVSGTKTCLDVPNSNPQLKCR